MGMKRKSTFLITFLVIAILCLCGCKGTPDRDTLIGNVKMLDSEVRDKTEEEVHDILGEPSGNLSGFWGEIYTNSENKSVVIYYDSDGKVERVDEISM